MDWRTAMLLIGVASWVLLMPAALLVRPPPVATGDADAALAAPAAAQDYP